MPVYELNNSWDKIDNASKYYFGKYELVKEINTNKSISTLDPIYLDESKNYNHIFIDLSYNSLSNISGTISINEQALYSSKIERNSFDNPFYTMRIKAKLKGGIIFLENTGEIYQDENNYKVKGYFNKNFYNAPSYYGNINSVFLDIQIPEHQDNVLSIKIYAF